MIVEDEKKYRIQIKGVSPFIMHSCQGADPQNHYTKLLKPLKAKRTKTDSDYEKIKILSFMQSLYWSETKGCLVIPVENIIKMMLEAGRKLDKMKAREQIVALGFDEHIGFPLITEHYDNLKKLEEDPKNKYTRIVTIQKAKVTATRAIFNDWYSIIELKIDTSILDPKVAHDWMV